MSEVQQRPSPPRGRGSSRGGRGGSSYGSRGGAAARPTRNSNGDINVSYSSVEDQTEVAQLKKQYASQLETLKDMFFPNWSAEDLLTVLQENNGDVHVTVNKISDGLASPWGEVKKKSKDRSRSKAKEPSSAGANNDSSSSRGARGTKGNFEVRPSGRGRGAGREPRGGGGGGRAVRGAFANGATRLPKDLIEEATAAAAAFGEAATETEADLGWGDGPKDEPESNGAGGDTFDSQSGWGDVPKAASDKAIPKTSIIQPGAKASWASLLKPVPPPPAPVQKKPSPPKEVSPQPTPQPTPQPQAVPEPKEPEPAIDIAPPPREITPEPLIEPVMPQLEDPIAPPAFEPEPEPEVELEVPIVPEVKESIPSPPQQPLTEYNLEKIEDTAPPPPTTTQASTIASPVPAPSISSSIAPPLPQPTATTPRPVYSGVAMPKGTPRLARRVLDQQEGVVMPSNHGTVEHATLQFGSMGLNGDLDDEDEVEQAETVSQPPQPSPIAQPVTALPPAQLPVSQPPVTEPLPTPRQAPGLPTHPQVAPQQPSQPPPLAPHSMTQQQQHISSQYNRYTISDSQQQPQTKAFEAFGAPVQQQSTPQPQSQPQQAQPQPPQSQQYAGYVPAQLPHQQPSHIGVGVSTTPDQQPQYNNYYDRSQPPGFGNLYNSSYMQGQSQQDAGANQQRASSGLGGAGEALSQIPTSAPGPGQAQQPTSRYGASQAGDQSSNHGTPSPAISTIQTSQPHNPAIQQQYPGGIPAYGYQHPAAYYSQFMHQNYYNHPNPFGKHQGMYGYPQYMSPQYSDHSSTAAGLGGFGTPSTQGRESVGLGDYGRMNATTSQQQQSLPQHSSAGAYGSAIPNFLNSRGLPEQQQLGSGVAQQQAAQQAQNDESMKFGENKPPTGPSSTPSIPGQPGRPGSATSGANMGPQHGAQTPASMYGSHLNHNLHGQQAQHSQQYGIGQGQSAASQYSMYTGAYPYNQSSGRHTNAGWGGYGQH